MNKVKSGKPECRICESERLDRKFAGDLIYSIFNPYHATRGRGSVSEYIKEKIEDVELRKNYEIFFHLFNDLIKDFGYANFSYERFEKYRKARKKAWKEIKEKINRREMSRNYFSTNDLVNHFYEEILRDLIKEGYIKKVRRGMEKRHIVYSPEAERVLAEKVLKITIHNLEKKWYGEEQTSEKGTSASITSSIEKFDPFLHTFDMIDIQETLIKSAMRSQKLEIDEKDVVIREPEHLEKCIYILLLDVSDSMRGRKIIGAIESALALRKAIRKKSQDKLYVIAFNHSVRKISEGDVLNISVNGRTDIGLALKTARLILRKREGTGIIFLITDGEPTSSSIPDSTPWNSAIVEAGNLRAVDARLSIIMFGKERRFINLCRKMAEACKKSNVVFLDDPLNLKSYVVRSYLKR